MSITPTLKRRRGRPRGNFPSLLVWRLSLNLNQREAAQILGMNQTKYSRLERGVITTKGAEAKHIIARTGVPLEILAGVA
jgi:transcriptional regulator with XRE-family HTH domain